MIKKINKYQLKLGMYIQSLGSTWMTHSFIRGSFMLRKEADLNKIIASNISEVYIDTLKGLDTRSGAGPEEPGCELPGTLLEAGPGSGPLAAAPLRGWTSHLEELATAKSIKREADTIIHSLLLDVRMGRQIQVEHLEPVVTRITDSVLRNPGTLVSLCRIREADTCTFQHSVSACALLVMFGHHLSLDRPTLLEAGIGGMLHDIGKMRVPDHILNKPGKLTDDEFAIMRDHVQLGVETLAQTPGVSGLAMRVAAEHHERFDGSGYPRGLRGDQISLLGRMATIVDVYDAMTSIRIYHHGIEPAEALQQLYQEGPGCFDEELVEQFIQAIGIYPVGSLVRLESNRLAVVMEQNEGGLLHPKVRVVYDIGEDRALAPFDLDLSRPERAGDAVLSHEEPATWNLDPDRFLNMEL